MPTTRQPSGWSGVGLAEQVLPRPQDLWSKIIARLSRCCRHNRFEPYALVFGEVLEVRAADNAASDDSDSECHA
jgi:hypothetical protein